MPDNVVNQDIGFPSTGTRVFSTVLHILGTTILAHCLSRRLAQTDLSSWRAITRLTWPRVCMLLVFLDSWFFLFSSGLLELGVGLEANKRLCMAAVTLCISFYVTSKVFIYFFLIEKVHIVWQPCPGTRRFSSPLFIFCFLTVCLYVVVAALLLAGRVHHLQQDGKCLIGSKTVPSILLLSYDLFVNILFTVLFVWPLMRFNFANSFVRRIAVRTLVAAIVALTTSTVNVGIIAVLDGGEVGWFCFASCGIDIIVNALALFFATSGSSVSSDKTISFRFPDIHITTFDAAPGTFTVATEPGIRSSVSMDCATPVHKLSLKSFLDNQRWAPEAQVAAPHENPRTTENPRSCKAPEFGERSSDCSRFESWV